MADEKPAWSPFKDGGAEPAESKTSPDNGWSPFKDGGAEKTGGGLGFSLAEPPEKSPRKPKETSAWGAFGAHTLHGLTFHWGDELLGLAAQGGLHELEMQAPGSVDPSLLRHSREMVTGVARDYLKKSASEEEHPIASTAGEIAGGIGTAALIPELGAANKLFPGMMQRAANGSHLATFGKRAANAAEIGTVSGALEGAGEGENPYARFKGGALGAPLGAIGGLAGSGLVGFAHAIGAGVRKTVQPLYTMARGYLDPYGNAGRAVARTVSSARSAGQQGLTRPEYDAAKALGDPVANVDLGGPDTHALARIASYTPEAREVMQQYANTRFSGQAERAAATVQGIVPSKAFNVIESAKNSYDAVRGRIYNAVYDAHDRPIKSDELDALAALPEVRRAMVKAAEEGPGRAFLAGRRGFNSNVEITPDGRVIFRRGPSGPPTYPNLEFWDYTRRALDKMRKDPGEPDTIKGIAARLNAELDRKTNGDYEKARGVASKFFDTEDALEAGEAATRWKPTRDVGELRNEVAKMGTEEKLLFQIGHASAVANKISSSNDAVNATNRLFQSPQARSIMEAIHGSAGVDKLEAMIRRERVYDRFRTAFGNSWTMRNAAEAALLGGLTGGGASLYFRGWEPVGTSTAAAAGAGALAAGRLGVNVALGKMTAHLDQATSKEIAKLMTADSPDEIERFINMAARNKKIMNALVYLDHVAGAYLGGKAARNATNGPDQ